LFVNVLEYVAVYLKEGRYPGYIQLHQFNQVHIPLKGTLLFFLSKA